MIKTPETHPDHPVVGHTFAAYCPYDSKPAVYYCDSYDTKIGYWMRREDCPEEHKQDESGKWRRNVSERAIDRTFHTIYIDDRGIEMTVQGRVRRDPL